MSDADYLAERAHQELRAAMLAFDVRVRSVHLQLADAYASKLSEIKREERRWQFMLMRDTAGNNNAQRGEGDRGGR